VELKSVLVQVEGVGEVEIREPLFDDIEKFFDDTSDQKKFGINLLKQCLYKDGQRIFESKVSAAVGMKLMALAPQVMALVGFESTADAESGKP
jgi:hypothetical protein